MTDTLERREAISGFVKDEQGISDAECIAVCLDSYARDKDREKLPETARTLRRGAELLRAAEAALPLPAREVEADPFDDCLGVHVQANAARHALATTPAPREKLERYEADEVAESLENALSVAATNPAFGGDMEAWLSLASAAQTAIATLRNGGRCTTCDDTGEAVKALATADAAIKEMFRYYDGGETRGSYDGRPERDQLRKAGYAVRATLAKLDRSA